MYIDKWTLVVVIVAALLIVGFLRQIGLLAGARQAVTDLSRACSMHYERDGEDLPEVVDKALTYMKDAIKRGKGAKGKFQLYLDGAGMLGDAMGDAAYARGIEGGRQCTQPSDGEIRVDMTEREIRTLAWLADVGFHHVIEGGRTTNFASPAEPRRRRTP